MSDIVKEIKKHLEKIGGNALIFRVMRMTLAFYLSAHFAFSLFFLLNRSEWVPVRESEMIFISMSLT